ncbi:hypothetical protein E2C01_014811 [Portunus trituberculatus]|uniref:Uncharacterized protein n=1 Tax=Portunus trituberculatus TaxID=210409 RepID=A0A5B7DJR3_PORTR|nr:hypothetical protein [Portunus trituberculatus]
MGGGNAKTGVRARLCLGGMLGLLLQQLFRLINRQQPLKNNLDKRTRGDIRGNDSLLTSLTPVFKASCEHWRIPGAKHYRYLHHRYSHATTPQPPETTHTPTLIPRGLSEWRLGIKG